ncbi:MAG TPA: YceI family protein [Gemmatimonadaceae bacterium]|jgi:polyisoprenoid-binding protein YceI|nr:YceI family protein [Gemmatimonadaceae bacterium]
MKRTTLALGFAALAAFSATGAAQTAGTQLALRQDSKLSLDGTSTLHPFTCATSTIDALVSVDSAYRTQPMTAIAHPIIKVDVTIPVKTLKCGHDKMDDNMYGTLKANDFPEIHYVLNSYQLVADQTTADSFVAKTTGTLTVSGKSQPVEMLVTGKRSPDGVAHATGTVEILMTDFGIKPPSFFLGTLKVGNKIAIKFDLSADRATAVSAGMAMP